MDKYVYATISKKLYDIMVRRLLLFSLFNRDESREDDCTNILAYYDYSLAEILPNRIIITVFPSLNNPHNHIVYSFTVV